jgi:hypothetical protein
LKAAILYRIASVIFVLFAAGHTVGFLTLVPPSPEARAVYEGMNSVHFQVRGESFSYGGFYRGFGLSITVTLLFSAFLAWYLGTLAGSNPQAIGWLGWAFTLVQVISIVLSWKYFATGPVIFAAVVAICLGWAAWLVGGKG